MRWKSVIFRLSPVVERESRQSTTVSKISPEICSPRTSHQKLRSETRFRTVAESRIAAPVPAEPTIVLARTSSWLRTFFRSMAQLRSRRVGKVVVHQVPAFQNRIDQDQPRLRSVPHRDRDRPIEFDDRR